MRATLERLRSVLPQVMALGDGTWQRRHRLALLLLAAHVPALAAAGLVAGHGPRSIGLALPPTLAGLVLGSAAGRSRVVRACAVSAGLVVSSAALVHLSGAAAEAHLHAFVVLGVVGLYGDLRPYALAIAGLAVAHGPLAAAALLAVGIAQVAFWKLSDGELDRTRHYYRDLYEGERERVTHLQQAEQLKTELIAIVSHEFRTPLTAIQGYAKTMTARWDQLEPEQLRRCAHMVERQSRRLSRLVSGLLSASGDVAYTPGVRTSVAEVAADVVEELDEFPGGEHPIVLDVPARLTVAANAEALQQILCNLLDNARKFAAPDTPVRLWARRHGDIVRLEVTNRGEPIPAEDLDRIFEPFVQRDSSDSRRHGGIGLGLYIVRKLVDALGGTVSVHNAQPFVVVIVELPAGDAPPATLVVDVQESQRVGLRT